MKFSAVGGASEIDRHRYITSRVWWDAAEQMENWSQKPKGSTARNIEPAFNGYEITGVRPIGIVFVDDCRQVWPTRAENGLEYGLLLELITDFVRDVHAGRYTIRKKIKTRLMNAGQPSMNHSLKSV